MKIFLEKNDIYLVTKKRKIFRTTVVLLYYFVFNVAAALLTISHVLKFIQENDFLWRDLSQLTFFLVIYLLFRKLSLPILWILNSFLHACANSSFSMASRKKTTSTTPWFGSWSLYISIMLFIWSVYWLSRHHFSLTNVCTVRAMKSFGNKLRGISYRTPTPLRVWVTEVFFFFQ